MRSVDKRRILYGFVGLLAGLLIGFFVANRLNRGEVDALRAELSNLRAHAPARAEETSGAKSSASSLTDEEIRDAIASADARPADLYLQRNLGLALYRYSTQTPNAFYLADVVRLLKRAYEGNSKDYEAVVALANVLMERGQSADPKYLLEARAYYLKALALKPEDVETRTALGLTYYLGNPSEPQRAISEYRRSLLIDPHHELTLQNLAAALISTGGMDEARKRIEELSGLNPSNPALPDLRARLAQRTVMNRE